MLSFSACFVLFLGVGLGYPERITKQQSSISRNPRLDRAWQRFSGAYRGVALILLNLFVLVVVANVGLFIVFGIRDAVIRGAGGGPAAKYHEEKLSSVYPGLSHSDRDELLRETWSRPLRYADYIMFKEQPWTGRFVNVAPPGYRLSRNQGPWPPDPRNLNIFVFGGSTTFGYGVADEDTVPSYLQEVLAVDAKRRVCVYNFGAGSYYSTQERILLQSLLSAGHVPHIALFIDGMNECEFPDDRPDQSQVFEQAFNQPTRLFSLGAGADRVPMVRAAKFVGRKLAARHPSAQRPISNAERDRLWPALAKYRQNKVLIEAICRQFSIQPLFVWQPAPGFQYGLEHHLFPDLRRFEMEHIFYTELEKDLAGRPLGEDFLWCADIQRGAKECLYVDVVHYTARFSRQFADVIAQRSRERGLLQRFLSE